MNNNNNNQDGSVEINENLENQMTQLNVGEREVVLKLSNKHSDDKIRELWRTLQTSRTESINLYANRSFGQLSALCQALAVNCNLRVLDLENFGLDDEGAKLVARALESEQSGLLALNLTGNQIKYAGAEYLANALKKNQRLRELNLRDNSLGNRGAEAIANGIACNSTLVYLNLCKNEIGNAGASALARALRQTFSLKTLNLAKQYVSRKVMAKINEDIHCVQAVLTLRSAQTVHRVGQFSPARILPMELVRLLYDFLQQAQE